MRVSKAVGLCASLAGLWSVDALSTSASGLLQQDRRFASSTGVTLVEVVAFVSDKNGRPVNGLTREDFALNEDGVRQDITNFSFVELPRSSVRTAARAPGPAVRNDVAANESRTGRSYVIVLDAQHVDPVRTGSVKQQARKFINDYVEPGDAVAVVTLGGSGNQSFTSDKARLIAVVESFIGGKSRSGALNKLESLIRNASDLPPSDYETAIKAADARTLFDSIRMICSSFGTVPGRRRSIVLFSEGIELDITDTMGTATRIGDDAQSASSQASTYAGELLNAQRAMFDAARKSNVSLYTVDPRGTSAGEDNLMKATGAPVGRNQPVAPPTREIQNEVQRGQGVLRNFAAETGGLAVVNTTDFDRGFSRIADANSTYYVLGYSPTNPVTNGRYRKISVRVDRPGVSVSARPGYFPVGAEASSMSAPSVSLNLKGASSWMNALLVSALPVAGLGIQVVGVPVGLRGQDHVVAVVVELQSSGFRFTEEGDSIRTRDRAAPAGLVVGAYGDSVPTTGEYPVLKSLFPALPTTSRHFTTDQRLAVYVPIPGSPAKQGAPVSVTLTVRRPDGTVVLKSPAIPAKSGNPLGTSVLGSVIDLPLDGLAPGQYLLGAEVSNGGRSDAIAPVSFVVSARR